MKTRLSSLILFCAIILLSFTACTGDKSGSIPYWKQDSPAMASIVSFVSTVADEKSESFVPEKARIAVFDMDGTLYGERFPTYFDDWMLIHRLAHDSTYQAAPEDRTWALSAEAALLNGEPEPDSPRSGAQMAAEAFKGFTVDEYRAYVRGFMDEPAVGFEGMTLGEGFFLPMVELVKYLSDNGFTIFISSGSERSIVRELTEEVLSEWIPSYHIIGSTFSLTADGQKDTEGRKYTYKPDDNIRFEGNLTLKNQKMNKVTTIIDEIGVCPLLVFGNSSGDISMAQYAVQHGGMAYMLLCDDTERDYGDPDEAAAFEETCRTLGFFTVSMRDEFETIYRHGVVKIEHALQGAA